MSDGRDIIALVAQRQDCEQFRRKNWVGTFAEYLDIVREHPEVTRTAYQRLYDMILVVRHGSDRIRSRETRSLSVLLRSGKRRATTPCSGSIRRCTIL